MIWFDITKVDRVVQHRVQLVQEVQHCQRHRHPLGPLSKAEKQIVAINVTDSVIQSCT